MEDFEGTIVASQIADAYRVTKSIIVNALKKLELAGVLESRLLGMRGTYIKVKNPKIIDVVGDYQQSLVEIKRWKN